MMQDLMRLSFDEFARHLRAVFDAVDKRGNKVFVEKEGVLSRLKQKTPRKSLISGQTMTRRK